MLAMKFELRKSERVAVVFRGWSCSAAIEFKKTTLMEKVYQQICSIEATRKITKERASVGPDSSLETKNLKIITAEIHLAQRRKRD